MKFYLFHLNIHILFPFHVLLHWLGLSEQCWVILVILIIIVMSLMEMPRKFQNMYYCRLILFIKEFLFLFTSLNVFWKSEINIEFYQIYLFYVFREWYRFSSFFCVRKNINEFPNVELFLHSWNENYLLGIYYSFNTILFRIDHPYY